MARLPRLSLPGVPQHVLQRGNDRATIFRDDDDRARYLEYLHHAASGEALQLHAYVLMDSHVHLLATPPDAGAIGRVMQSLGRRYVRGFNAKYARSGTLWEGRYRSHVLEANPHLLPVSLYIETNPVRHGIASEPAHYAWSSYRHHVGHELNPQLQDHPAYWLLGNTPYERQAQYRLLALAGLEDAQMARIRYAVHSGWALGSEQFLQLLASTGKRAAPTRRGRKSLLAKPV